MLFCSPCHPLVVRLLSSVTYRRNATNPMCTELMEACFVTKSLRKLAYKAYSDVTLACPTADQRFIPELLSTS